MDKPIVVIGSGMAAYFFAKEFRENSVDRPLVIVTMTDGRFYSKPLLSTALTQKKSIDQLSMMSVDAMRHSLNADIITHATVTAVDAKARSVFYTLKAGGAQSLEYSDLVIACGAEVLQPKLQGNAITSVHSINQIEDYEGFRQGIEHKKSIGVLGAGFVGCEFANDLVNSGYEATVIAPESYPLARLVPKPIGDKLYEALSSVGVKWRLGRFAQQVDRRESCYDVTLDDGSTMSFDAVISAVGIIPKLEIAQSAGITINHGIVVDSQCRTSHPHIYALGDCAEFDGQLRQYVAPLLQSARLLAKVLVGEAVEIDYPIMPAVVKTPACPIVVVSPASTQGQWLYDDQEGGLTALFKDTEGRLKGFALCGSAVAHKIALIKQMQGV